MDIVLKRLGTAYVLLDLVIKPEHSLIVREWAPRIQNLAFTEDRGSIGGIVVPKPDSDSLLGGSATGQDPILGL